MKQIVQPVFRQQLFIKEDSRIPLLKRTDSLPIRPSLKKLIFKLEQTCTKIQTQKRPKQNLAKLQLF